MSTPSSSANSFLAARASSFVATSMSPPVSSSGVEQAALDSVGGLAVREYLRVDFLDVEPGLIVVVREHFARARLPCVVHRNEGRVLGYHELHLVVAEPPVLNQPQVGFPCGDRAPCRCRRPESNSPECARCA